MRKDKGKERKVYAETIGDLLRKIGKLLEEERKFVEEVSRLVKEKENEKAIKE